MLPQQQRAEIELNRRRSPSQRWRGEDEIVQLAFDFVELRQEEEGVRRREARVRELEEECKALGIGTEDTEEQDDEEEDDDEEEEASGRAPDTDDDDGDDDEQ
jgi:hypothetical protein